MDYKSKPGTPVPIVVYRNNQRKTMNVTVDELDLDAEQGRLARRGGSSPDQAEPTATGFGMSLEPVSPDVARDLPRNAGGAMVSDVDREGPAFNSGVQPGDVILEVNRQEVTRELSKVQPGQPAFLLVWRDGQNIFVTMSRK